MAASGGSCSSPEPHKRLQRAALLVMEEGSRRAVAAAALPDELVVEILARLPVKSLCRFTCVSRAWRDLISDPANRRRFAQTLSGLFFSLPVDPRLPWGFLGLPPSPPPGVDTALSFLPRAYGEMELLDSCNGLLLLRCTGGALEEPPSPPFYVVCNPATGEWVVLPQPRHAPGIYAPAALGFDPAVSSKFHVFQLVQELYYEFFVEAVEIYSSETSRWVFKGREWSGNGMQCTGQMTYFNGFLHFCIISNSVAAVDTEGQSCRVSRVRQDAIGGYCNSVGHSQGRLLYVYDNVWENDAMSIYFLEDHDSEEWVWTLKLNISKTDLFGPPPLRGGWNYYIAAFHPDSDVIFFFDWSQRWLVSYDMKRRDVYDLCTLQDVLDIEQGEFFVVHRLFLPYVPSYSGTLALSSVK